MEQHIQSNTNTTEDWIQEQHEWLESFEEIIKQQGADALRFLRTIKELLEEPFSINV